MKTAKLKVDGAHCGCIVEVVRDAYVKMCDKHESEWKELHERALREHREATKE